MVQTDNSQSHWFSLSKYILWFFYNFYEEIVKESFNTSHVTLYQSAGRPGIPRCRVSIHHMLLFICSRQDSGENVPGFQYITCYSLSKKRVRKNTGRILFQYITCYSLSPPSPVSAPPTEVFQYITCYSLS